MDVLVEDIVICELKAIELVNPVWEAQLIKKLATKTRRRKAFCLTLKFTS